MKKCAAAMVLALSMAGCGETPVEVKDAVVAPVNNIQQNIKIGDDLKKSVRESVNINAATEAELSKKKGN